MALSNILLATICGFERSGTTMLLDIFRGHPGLDSGFETFLLGYDRLGDLKKDPERLNIFQKGWDLTDTERDYVLNAESHKMAYHRLRQCSPQVKNRNCRLLDKTPSYLHDLREVLRRSGDTPTFVILRDPKAVMHSWMNHDGVTRRKQIKNLIPQLSQRLNEGLRELELALEEYPKRIHLVSYEQLCFEPETVLKRLCHATKLRWIPELVKLTNTWPNTHGDSITTNHIWKYRKFFTPAECRRIDDLVDPFPSICPQRFTLLMPVCDPPIQFLDEAVHSIVDQKYPLWELILTDDACERPRVKEFFRELPQDRIQIVHNKVRQGISRSLNSGLDLAWGNIVGTMDHDDILDPTLLTDLNATMSSAGSDIAYTDEYMILEDKRTVPFFKPDFSPDLLLGNNFMCHFVAIQKKIMRDVGGFDPAFDGAQDYDMALKATERTDRISHLPKPLYFWRRHSAAFSRSDRRRRELIPMNVAIVENAMARRKVPCTVEPGLAEGTVRVRRKLQSEPLVSVIIPFRDRPDLLEACLRSLTLRTTYSNYEIIAVDNGSVDPKVAAILDAYQNRLGDRFQVLRLDIPFNYGLLNNDGALRARGEHLIFLNNDTQVISPPWIEAMLEHGQRDEVGGVGARLTYSNGCIQHAGVIIGFRGVAGHQFHGLEPQFTGYLDKTLMIQNLSAVTGACMLMRKSLFIELGGYNTTDLKDDFTDVDLCLRIRETGRTIIYTPYAHLLHRGTASRPMNDGDTIYRYSKYMYQRHSVIYTDGDPYYNPNFSLDYDHIPRNVINSRSGRQRANMKPSLYETMNRFRPRTHL